jgi:hypothetical protein
MHVNSHISKPEPPCGVEVLISLLRSEDDALSSHEDTRLDRLVWGLLELDASDVCRLGAIAGDSEATSGRNAAGFFDVLHQTIYELGLSRFFCRISGGEWHRSICPSAYDERTGRHDALEMAKWRADFRGLAPERQMVCATIIWLYRGGSDSTWLRRVPSNWRAREALLYMRDAGCLGWWLKLIARYPGW